ncbi:MAG: TSUP family transporter [Lachnospiraceae bacterium]|nr:TSUP family transporter [Ruminococcus sp.]MCM1275661.1 TSUP family transporter [Lachnospiraceae bacterium]
MEYFWYVVAALGAGVGTGLAGLSAATVMVPILIVLCPSFAGEAGAYHATAIALASDILGSAVTTSIYIKHKNIDLKRGWIMLACIVAMCVAGSVVAWQAGNVVLGSFTLFLTFCIGIRFLVKPDTSRKETEANGARLNAKGIAISLFFGLTIGFGTGFVGSGGGMMMLVVFTAFLGMERKAAVGTSTFIMTFTALIASASHIAVDPTILFERWDVLLICIIVATAASIVSAQFANRVNNRVVGLVTGAILTVLGALMLILNYWEFISKVPLIADVLLCLGKYLLFLACFVAVLLLARVLFKIPKALWRKLLHMVAYTGIVFMIFVSENWLAPTICCVLFAAGVYPILHIAEKRQGFGELFVQKSKGEVKKSLLLLFLTEAALTALCWGLLGKPHIVATAVIVWGVGDTMAALIGIKFGRHHVKIPLADPKKTWEGSAAMAVTDLIVCFALLLILSGLPVWKCAVFSLVIAPLSAYAELISHNGSDTVSVPVSIAAALSLLTLL